MLCPAHNSLPPWRSSVSNLTSIILCLGERTQVLLSFFFWSEILLRWFLRALVYSHVQMTPRDEWHGGVWGCVLHTQTRSYSTLSAVNKTWSIFIYKSWGEKKHNCGIFLGILIGSHEKNHFNNQGHDINMALAWTV